MAAVRTSLDPRRYALDGPRRFSNSPGCLNPLCPHANWSDGSLPRWWLRLDDGDIVEFAACDETCAREASHIVSARLGREFRPDLTPDPYGSR